MNRMIVRALGGCMAVYGVFFGRDTSANAALGAKYEQVSVQIVTNGYSSTDEDFICSQQTMIGGTCKGVCNATGTFCSGSQYFIDAGCVEGGACGSCIYASGANATVAAYTFTECVAGFYLVAGAATNPVCNTMPGEPVYTVEELGVCCSPCPKMNLDLVASLAPTGVSGVTVTHTGVVWDGEGTNSASGWTWTADADKYGVSACVANYENYGVKVGLTDSAGTFSLSVAGSGCTYSDTTGA